MRSILLGDDYEYTYLRYAHKILTFVREYVREGINYSAICGKSVCLASHLVCNFKNKSCVGFCLS